MWEETGSSRTSEASVAKARSETIWTPSAADGAEGVIVTGDDVVDDGGVAVGVDDGDDRDAELAGFGDGDGLVVGVDDEEGVGQALHALDAGEVGGEVLALALELDDF